MDTWSGEAGPFTGMTSRPMPSPGIKPIRSDLGAIGSYIIYHASNAKGNFLADTNAKIEQFLSPRRNGPFSPLFRPSLGVLLSSFIPSRDQSSMINLHMASVFDLPHLTSLQLDQAHKRNVITNAPPQIHALNLVQCILRLTMLPSSRPMLGRRAAYSSCMQ